MDATGRPSGRVWKSRDWAQRTSSAAPTGSSIARLALTVATSGGAELLFALSGKGSGGCAAVNGVDVPLTGVVGGWLPLPRHADASVQLVEFFGYGNGLGNDDGDPGWPEATIRYTEDRDAIDAYFAVPARGVAADDLRPIGEDRLCA